MEALYIHIPFCSKICTYCDFAKEVARDSKKEAYMNALVREVAHYQSRYDDLGTVYIGGGTPSSMARSELKKLFVALHEAIDFSKVEEFTIECNPNDVTKELATLFKAYGVNRISLGVQTFNEKHLKALNREHTNKDVFQAIKYFKHEGIENISLDLIFSLPAQTLEELDEDLNILKELDMPHVSFYSLILEEKSILYHKALKGKVTLSDEDTEAAMYVRVMDALKAMGYTHYEISNYTKGFPSRHNTMYWRNKDYGALGVGAHGKLDETRFYNAYRVNDYIERVNRVGFGLKETYPYEAMRDTMLMGLRLLEGVNKKTFFAAFNQTMFEAYPELKRFVDEGFLEETTTHVRFTRKGLLLGNLVFEIF